MVNDLLELHEADASPSEESSSAQDSAALRDTAPDPVASAPAGDEHAPDYADVLERLSAALPRAALSGSRLQSDAFLDLLSDFRRRVHNREHDASVAAFPDVCDDYLKRARAYLHEREQEYLELVEVLRDTVSRVAGESTAFHAELTGVSERLNTFADIDDLRDIKQRIARESAHLQEATDEQKRQAENTLSNLTRRVETLQTSLNQAKEQAETDALTGIPNRGRFDQTIARWMHAFNASGQPFVLALADIDNFKSINDTHGHPVGDRVLMATAQWLAASVRGTDLVARYGGEEFAVLFSSVSLSQAEARLGEVFHNLATRRFAYQGETEEKTVAFTVSAGITECASGDTVESLVRRADEGLYDAKRRGKNRIIAKKKSRLASLFG